MICSGEFFETVRARIDSDDNIEGVVEDSVNVNESIVDDPSLPQLEESETSLESDGTDSCTASATHDGPSEQVPIESTAHESSLIQLAYNLNDVNADAVEVFYDCEDEITAEVVNVSSINEEQGGANCPTPLQSESTSETRGNRETSENKPDYDHLVGGDGNLPIFPGLSCTKGQLVSLVLAFYLRFPNSKESLEGLLKLLDAIIPNCIRSTKYFFDRYFFGGLENFETHYVCPICFLYIGRSDTNYCTSCKRKFSAKECKKNGSYLLTKSIKSQLTDMLQSGELWRHIQNRPTYAEGIYGEVYSGDLYKNVNIESFLRSGDNFTLTVNTDGVQVFQSSKYQIWPIMCSINEIDSKFKSQFIVLQTLWFGLGKLRIDSFLKAFVDEARDLFTNGFEWVDSKGSKRLSRIIFTNAVADAPARAHLLERMQFNAEYGCDFCEHSGVNVAKGSGRVQVFPLQHPLPNERTHESSVHYGEIAAQYGIPVMGIKGPTLLAALMEFDIVKSVIPDSMHCLWLGIVVQFRKLWESSTEKAYYIKNMNVEIDKYICKVKPPNEIHRTPRSLVNFGSDWKATENRTFCFFYSPIALKDLLPLEYYEHWLLFVNGCLELFRKDVTSDNIKTATRLFDKFVLLVPELYGLENVTYNVHLLQHISQFVKYWGAPWANSAFLFEDAGGDLIRQFHGTRYVSEQIFTNFLAKPRLKRYAKKYMTKADDSVKGVFESFDCKIDKESPRSELLGKSSSEALDVSYLTAINECFKENNEDVNCNCDSILSHDRVLINGTLFCTKEYCADKQRDNSIVQLGNEEAYTIVKILHVAHDISCDLDDTSKESVVFVGEKVDMTPIRPHIDTHSKKDLTAFIKKINRTQRNKSYKAFQVSQIKHKGVYVGNDSQCFCIFHNVCVEKV